MSDKLDFAARVTAAMSKAIDALFVGNPIKTAFGVLIGLLFKGLVDFAFEILNFEHQLPYLVSVPGGVLLMHKANVTKKYNYDEGVETAIHYLEELQAKGNFTEAEKRRQWRRLVEQVYMKVNNSVAQTAESTTESADHNDLTPVS